MPLPKVLGVIADIYTAKAIEDATAEREGKPYDTLPMFLEDFFLRKFGLKKPAKKRLAEVIVSAMKYVEENPRIKVFATLCGLHEPELYHPDTVRAFVLFLRRLYPNHKQIAEKCNNEYGTINIRPDDAMRAFFGEGGKNGDVRTWDSPYFIAVSTNSGILGIAEAIKALPQIKAEKFGQAVHLDALLELLVESYNAQLTARLKATHVIFKQFDTDANHEMSLDEFSAVMENYMGGRFTPRQTLELFPEMQGGRGRDRRK
eukprot:FR738624.1.p1 GENE.FR738624.1~~FR738624.1.p1  ORF type:complete len:304 (+),score=35.57 FR738624.1:134-913(+)